MSYQDDTSIENSHGNLPASEGHRDAALLGSPTPAVITQGYVLTFEQSCPDTDTGMRPYTDGEFERLISEFRNKSIDGKAKGIVCTLDDGSRSTELAFNIADRDTSIRLAKRENQPYIWDVVNNAPIPTGGTGHWKDDPRARTWPLTPGTSPDAVPALPNIRTAELVKEFWAQFALGQSVLVQYLQRLTTTDTVVLQQYLRGPIISWITDIRQGKAPVDAGIYAKIGQPKATDERSTDAEPREAKDADPELPEALRKFSIDDLRWPQSGEGWSLTAIANGTTKLAIAQTLATMSETDAMEAIYYLAEAAHFHQWRYFAIPPRIKKFAVELLGAREQLLQGELTSEQEAEWAADDWKEKIFFKSVFSGTDDRFNCCRTDGRGARAVGVFAY